MIARHDIEHAHSVRVRSTANWKELGHQICHPRKGCKRSELRRDICKLGSDATHCHQCGETLRLRSFRTAIAGAETANLDREITEHRAERGGVIALAPEL